MPVRLIVPVFVFMLVMICGCTKQASSLSATAVVSPTIDTTQVSSTIETLKTTSSTTKAYVYVTTTLPTINGQLLDITWSVESVVINGTTSPAGPIIKLTLKNISTDVIVSLSAEIPIMGGSSGTTHVMRLMNIGFPDVSQTQPITRSEYK